MRIALSVIFIVLILVLGVCTFFARRSRKPIGRPLALLLSSLIPPVWGNLFIIASEMEVMSWVGCYIFFLGMNYVMFAMLRFTFIYCDLPKKFNIIKFIAYGLLILDSIQLLLNPVTHHMFGLEAITAYDALYYQFVPFWGQTIHRVVDYAILGGIMIVFLIKSIVSPKVYAEKYYVVLFAMVAVAIWQTIYIVLRRPVDYSMIGFAVFGVLMFALVLYYRPLRLLDRMLATIASKMPESIFFFDKNGKCIWANDRALELVGINDTQLDEALTFLKNKVGDYSNRGDEWTETSIVGSGDEIVSYVIEKHAVIDGHQRMVGFYITVRDNSAEQKDLLRETFNAQHDALTKVLNRAGYDTIMDNVDLSKCFLLLIDLDSFKEVNDVNGHVIGDKVLVKVTETMSKHFRDDDCVCRIGGDEFAIVLNNVDNRTADVVKKKIDSINKELNDDSDLPSISISAGGAFGKDAENAYELYNNADHALYETKFAGKRGFTLFKRR